MSLKYPLVLPTAQGYSGFLQVGDAQYRIAIKRRQIREARAVDGVRRTTTASTLDGAQLQCEEALAQLLRPHRAIIEERLHKARDIDVFLGDLCETVERLRRADRPPPPLLGAANTDKGSSSKTGEFLRVYSRLLEDLETIGWSRLHDIDMDAQPVRIDVSVRDCTQRTHILTCLFYADYPASSPRLLVDAPLPFESDAARWNGERDSLALRALLDDAVVHLNQFTAFWDAMDALDACVCVIDPRGKALRAATHRRIALGAYRSVLLDFDWQRPLAYPVYRFVGNKRGTQPLRDAMADKCKEWRDDAAIADNLRRVLGVDLPPPTAVNEAENASICAICFLVREASADTDEVAERAAMAASTGRRSMEADASTRAHAGGDANTSVFPEETCKNARCGVIFHWRCLYDCLRSQPTHRVYFKTISGQCPTCTGAVELRIP